MAFVGSVVFHQGRVCNSQNACALLSSARTGLSSEFVTKAENPLRVGFPQQPGVNSHHADVNVIHGCVNLQMGLTDRFFRVLRANVGRELSAFEDPEKVLEQSVIDMQNEMRKVRGLYNEIGTTIQQMQRQKRQMELLASQWERRARLALENGDELLAREALIRKANEDEKIERLKKQILPLSANLNKIADSIVQLESKIMEAKNLKQELVMRARKAKYEIEICNRMNEITAGVNSVLDGVNTSGYSAFEQMRQKVEALEAECEAQELSSLGGKAALGGSLEGQFRRLEAENSVDSQLRQLRAEINSQRIPKQIGTSSTVYITVE